MKNTRHKIEEAMIKPLNKKVTLNDLIELNLSDKDLFETISTELYCPECFQAKLIFAAGKKISPYLKTKQLEKHDENCQYIQNLMNDKEREKFVNNSKPKDIFNDIEQLRKLLDESYSSKTISESLNKADRKYNYSNEKRMPRKRIDLPLEEDDYDVFKYFYGKVNTKFVVLEKYGYSLLKIMSLDNKTTYLSIRISNNVYLYLDEVFTEDLKNTDFFYLGKIYKYNNQNRSIAIKSYFISN